MSTTNAIFKIMNDMHGDMLTEFLNYFTDTIHDDDLFAEEYRIDGKTGRILLQSEKFEMVLELRQVTAKTKEKLAPGVHVHI